MIPATPTDFHEMARIYRFPPDGGLTLVSNVRETPKSSGKPPETYHVGNLATDRYVTPQQYWGANRKIAHRPTYDEAKAQAKIIDETANRFKHLSDCGKGYLVQRKKEMGVFEYLFIWK